MLRTHAFGNIIYTKFVIKIYNIIAFANKIALFIALSYFWLDTLHNIIINNEVFGFYMTWFITVNGLFKLINLVFILVHVDDTKDLFVLYADMI